MRMEKMMGVRLRVIGFCLFILFGSFSTVYALNVKVISRMSYYTDEKIAEILVCLPEKCEGLTHAQAILEGNNNPFMLHEGVNILSIPTSVLRKGNNTRAITIEMDGKVRNDTVSILYLPAKSNEVKIDRLTGTLRVDGWQWIPVGYYSSLKGSNFEFLRSEVTQGINLYSPYHTISEENQNDRMAYLELCAQLGIKVNYNLCSLAGSQGVGLNVDGALEEKLAALREEVLRVKDHPALLSYYIADEPDGQGVDPEVLKKSYDLIHELDPYHPVSVVIISALPARRYADAYDIVMADPYPIPNGPVTSASDMIRDIYEQMRYEKAVWLVPQVFGGGEIWTREPTAREVRAMIYASVLEGARGIQGFHRMPDSGSPLLWNGFKEVAVELQQITPYLYDDHSYEVSVEQGMLARVFHHGDDLLAVVQNMQNKPCKMVLSLQESIPDGTPARQIFENREVVVESGQIKDVLPSFGTGVYKIIKKQDVSNVCKGNLSVNPSFELSAEAGEMTGGSGGAGGNGATLMPDTRVAFDGETSLRLHNPFPDAGAARNLFPIDNESDRTYILSVWAKTDTHSLILNRVKGTKLTFSLTLGSLGEKEFELSDTAWTKFELVCPPQEYKRTHHGGVAGSIILKGEGTAWFDLVQITPEIFIHETRTADRKGFLVAMDCYLKDGEIRYTLDGSQPTRHSILYTSPFEVRSVKTVRARVYDKEGRAYPEESKVIAAHKALDAKVTYLKPYSLKYAAGGDGAMTDGRFAPLNAQAPLWHGYIDNDIDFVVDLDHIQRINRVSLGFLQSLTAWIMPPKEVEILISKDGLHYYTVKNIYYGEARKGVGEYDYVRIPFVFDRLKTEARYVRIKAVHPLTLPSWHRVQGKSWMFIDEVVIE